MRAYEMYRRNDGVRPLADTDLMVAAVPYDLLRRLHVPLSRSMQDDDKALLDALRAKGFLLDNGEDDTGYFLKLLRSQSGYYLNVGASDLIVEGAIGLKAGVDIARLERKRVVFSDGSALDADIVVLATGYQPMQEAVRLLFGGDVADRVGPVWGIGPDNELNAMYARTAQPGLFFAGGGFPAARAYSAYTAMLIKADLEGMRSYRDSSPPTPDRSMDRQRTRICAAMTLVLRLLEVPFSDPIAAYLELPMRDRLELPRLSIAERDRRWSVTREQMHARGIDCLVLWGWPAMWDFTTANARYLCPIGGNAENNMLVFPLNGEPTSFVFMPTFVEYWKRAQDWVSDVRSRRGTWSDTVVARLKEMGLERATHRHGWPRRPARSRWLASVQHL